MLNAVPSNIKRTPWMWELKPFKIADNLYFVGNRDVAVHLVDTGEGLLLLDTSYYQAAYMLFESIRALGFDPADIKWIIHSHGHVDHFGCTRILVERYGCKTYFPEEDLPLLDERADLNWHEEYGQNYEAPYDIYFEPDVLIKPGDVLTFGNTKVEVYAAGGHTLGTLCLRFLLPGGLTAAMHGGIGFNTLSAEYSQKKGLGTTWRDRFFHDLKALYDLPVDILLANHTFQAGMPEKIEKLGGEENPFIAPQEWNRFLAIQEARYYELLEKDPM